MNELFRRFAQKTSAIVGSPWMFLVAVAVIIVWATLGPMADYSDTWQLIINTGTTIITFLMVFLIQNTQNRDARAIHIKLDELLLSVKRARTSLVDLEECSDEELDRLQEEFRVISEQAKARAAARAAARDTQPAAEEILAMRNGAPGGTPEHSDRGKSGRTS